MNAFAAIATQEAAEIQKSIESQLSRATIRYIFNPFQDMRTDVINNGVIPFGQITPISIQRPPVGQIYLQPLLDADPMKEKDFMIRNGVGRIEIPPAPIVDELLSRYQHMGAIQCKKIFGLDIAEFELVNLNDLYFGQEIDELTEEISTAKHLTARSYLERFVLVEEKLSQMSASAQKERDKGMAKKLSELLIELRQSVISCSQWARREAENANVELANGDLKKFSPYHYRLFEYSGVTPRDAALNQIATDQGNTMKVIPQLLESIAEGQKANQPDWEALGRGLSAGIAENLKPLLEPKATEKAKPTPPANKPPTNG